jgi:protein gp37
VFCASLADVFDNQVDREWRRDLFSVIAKTKHLDWLLLTKRIGNVAEMLDDISVTTPALDPQWWPNVWLGITVVNQEEADRDIPKLLRVPAAVRFLSCEPLLEMISLDHEWLVPEYFGHSADCRDNLCALNGDMYSCVGEVVQQPSIDWIICGGESGPHAREMNPDWARLLREQCKDTGAAFFMKQMTGKAEIPEDLLIREFPSVDKGNAP